LRSHQEMSAVANRQAEASQAQSKIEMESLRRRVAELETEKEIMLQDRSSTKDSIEAQLAEEGARAQRLSEMLQTSERVGCNIRQELTKVKAEAAECKRNMQALERAVDTARNSLQETKEGAMTSEKCKDQLITDLQDELKRIRSHMEKIKQEYHQAAEEAADEKVQRAMQGARWEQEKCLELQRERLQEEAEQERLALETAINEARAEAERWKERLKECDELRKQQEATCAQESRRAEALQGELAQVNEELSRSKRQMTGDELRGRLESLKEVVSHTLKEKAELDEEVLCLKERLAAHEDRGGVVQDLQERLQTLKEMNSRLDTDNEDLRMRLHTAHATLRQHHIHLGDGSSDTAGSNLGRSIRTPGGRKLSSSSGRTSLRSSAGRRIH